MKLLGALMVVLVLAAFVELGRLIHLGRSSRRWPMVKGLINDVLIVEIQRSSSTTFRPTIRYAYRVDGQDYVSRRIDVGIHIMGAKAHDSFTQSGAARVLEGYARGLPVDVYYNPRRPGYSVLKPGASSGLYLIAITLGLAVITFIGVWVFLVPD